MHLLQSWKQSLQLLQPKNFGPFCLLVLNNMRSTVRVLMSCWPLGIIFLCCAPVAGAQGMVLVKQLCIFFLLLASRTIGTEKKFSYFVAHIKRYILSFILVLLLAYVLVNVLLGGFFALLIFFVSGITIGWSGMVPVLENHMEVFASLDPLRVYVAVVFFLVVPATNIIVMLESLALLFLFDTGVDLQSNVKSIDLKPIFQAARMVWYNLPPCLFFLVIGNLLQLPALLVLPYLSMSLHSTGVLLASGLLGFVGLWIYVAITVVFYTQFQHKNPHFSVDNS